jgi:acyl-homoserine lactone acylase PvdQ
MIKGILVSIFVLSFISGNTQPFSGSEINEWKAQASRVTIIRDTYGVPHIYGKTDADAIFGMLYAQCEDGFERVETNYINALGRAAEVDGERKIWSDLRQRLFTDSLEAIRLYQSAPAPMKKLLNAFASGINYYLYSNPKVKPKLITRFKPWMHLLFSEGSIGGDIANVSLAQLKDFYGRDSKIGASADEVREKDMSGSNGFSIAPAKSATGNALFYINPHTTFYFRCEVHVVSEEGLNVYGAVTWGQLFVYQGFNENCGWMHTSSKADVYDEYNERVEKRNDDWLYQYDKDWKKMNSVPLQIRYKKDGQLQDANFIGYKSHHGPVVALRNDKWVAVRMMNNPLDAITQSFMRTKSKGYQDFKKWMELRTNSSNNTVYADNQGNIAYWHGNFMPKRNPKFDWSQAVDGSTSETEWQGLHDTKDLIHILNPANGWIQNCNSTPFSAAGSSSPDSTKYLKYMAPDLENFRGIHAVKVLNSSNSFTLDNLLTAGFDPYLPAFEEMIPSLKKAWDTHQKILNPALKEPIEILSRWDMNISEKSVEATLATLWANKMFSVVVDLKRITDTEKIHIIKAVASKTTDLEKITALQEVMDLLKGNFGNWQMPWGELNRYQRPAGMENIFDDTKSSVPCGLTSSTFGALAAYESRLFPGTKKFYGTSGNSFVAVVEFGKKVTAKSILISGQSTDPTSKHFNDQAEGYLKGKFKDVWYYKADVLKHVEAKYRPGGR